MFLPVRHPIRLFVLTLPLVIAAAGAIGFAWFVRNAARATPLPPAADGIVALTGGAERIDTALRLLANDRGRVLLISGVHGGFDLHDTMRRLGLDPAALAARVAIGRQAESTWGNGREAADWAREHRLQSLIVVTAAYHMPRAMTELGRALPEAQLFPDAVLPLRPGPEDAATWLMLGREYLKLLGAEAGLGFLSHGHR